MDVSTTAAEVGIWFPVFLTRRVFDAYVIVPPNVTCQDEAGRFVGHRFDAPLCHQKRPQRRRPHRIFALRPQRQPPPKLVKLVAMCGPRDMDAPEPAITVMLPGED
jgi:hypothetical protein